MSEPSVAVIVPVFNGGRFLGESLRSIQEQTFQSWECIVVDDGSTDDTAAVAQEIVDRDPRFRLIRQQNAGTPTARNNGIAAARASVQYLAFVDGDDVWVPDALDGLTAALEKNQDAVGSYGLAEYLDASGNPMNVGLHSSRQRDRRRMGRFDLTPVGPDEPYAWSSWIVSGTLWPTAVALHRRSVVDDVGGFDSRLRQVQDWDLYLRMSRRGSFVPIDKQVAWYRQHDANVTSGTERVAFYSLWVRHKAWTAPDNTAAQRTELRRVWRRLVARWALSSLIATVRAPKGKTELRAGLSAVMTFSRLLLAGHPDEPDARTATLIAQFVSPQPSRASAA